MFLLKRICVTLPTKAVFLAGIGLSVQWINLIQKRKTLYEEVLFHFYLLKFTLESTGLYWASSCNTILYLGGAVVKQHMVFFQLCKTNWAVKTNMVQITYKTKKGEHIFSAATYANAI